jgi:ECF sigma factor
MDAITKVLNAIEQGDPQAAEQLLPLVYEELRGPVAQMLAQEAPGQTADRKRDCSTFPTPTVR